MHCWSQLTICVVALNAMQIRKYPDWTRGENESTLHYLKRLATEGRCMLASARYTQTNLVRYRVATPGRMGPTVAPGDAEYNVNRERLIGPMSGTVLHSGQQLPFARALPKRTAVLHAQTVTLGVIRGATGYQPARGFRLVLTLQCCPCVYAVQATPSMMPGCWLLAVSGKW